VRLAGQCNNCIAWRKLFCHTSSFLLKHEKLDTIYKSTYWLIKQSNWEGNFVQKMVCFSHPWWILTKHISLVSIVCSISGISVSKKNSGILVFLWHDTFFLLQCRCLANFLCCSGYWGYSVGKVKNANHCTSGLISILCTSISFKIQVMNRNESVYYCRKKDSYDSIHHNLQN
jgi:hypothetical protein